GAYVAGHVYLGPTTNAPTDYTVRACSTDEDGMCGPTESFGTSHAYDLDASNATLVGCPTDAGAFCIAAPPGPVKITATGSGAIGENWTWTEVPFRCCTASPHVLWIRNVTNGSAILLPIGIGTATGRVLGAPPGIEPPITQARVTACSAEYSATAPCSPSGPTTNTSFSVSAPLGWDSITAQATGYDSNTTWIDVTGTNRSGTIVLSPEAIGQGRVVDPNGSGILGAGLEYCPVTQTSYLQSGCQPFQSPSGSDITGTGGYYSGYLPGGPFPGSTYEIEASAGGYLDDWTWVNATPGALVSIPTIALAPVGPSGGPLAAGPRAPAASSATWIEGRLADASDGEGIANANLIACLFTGTHACTTLTDGSNAWGEFNASLPLGDYWLNASEPGYEDGSFFVNATGTATVEIGTVELTPYPWISGRVLLAPWESLTVSQGMGPGQASVSVCSNSGAECGPFGVASTAGFFNVSGPTGNNDDLAIAGSGGSSFDSLIPLQAQGSGFGGFDPNSTPVNVTPSGVVLPETAGSAPVLEIFSVVTGIVLDGSSWNASRHAPSAPARWASLVSTGPRAGDDANLPVSGGGTFDLFVPGGTSVRLDVSGSAFWTETNASVKVPSSAGLRAVPAFDLSHFGWVTATIRASSGAPLPYATVNASVPDPANGTRVSRGDAANGAGFINLSAPTGSNVTVEAAAPGYANASAYGSVLPNRASPFSVPGLVGGPSPLFYAESEEVNLLGGAPFPTVIDPLSGDPIAGASVTLEVNGALVNHATTNGLGQFLVSAPPAASYDLGFDRNGYATTSVPIADAEVSEYVQGQVDLVGDGIVAGEVVVVPSRDPVPNALVTACPIAGGGLCDYLTTNGAGEFWLEDAPGNYTLSITATPYSANQTYDAWIVSDAFAEIAPLDVFADATVEGNVVGEPFLLPVVGANVTLCPVNGSYSDFCAFPTPTDPLGGFAFDVPPGTYRLLVNASGYAPWTMELELLAGEVVPLGQIRLGADGG
ncbi:MAG TPA: carboxypeptidase regulatory-like domain-containing protein, partial [Thermoplasmata archaeon]|nr:carboxypeptidase regulatory-like domain-containing protein [Thermoplasmata archaeon]